MFEQASKTKVIERPRWDLSFIGKLVAPVAFLVIGYPLTPATIRAMLIAWILAVAGLTRIIWGTRARVNGSTVIFKKS